MVHYYDKQSAKVALSIALSEKGWKIYGFKNDESDMMTDYWSPAAWDGIAEKNGFILVIDQYSINLSGYEVKKYDYSKTRSNSDKIAKLQATVNDTATTPAEKETAQKLIDKLNSKDTTTSYEVIETYPIFAHKTPKACIWHIEKDGVIVAKGKGLYSLYSINEREETKKRMQELAEKFEYHMKDSSELVAVEKEVKTTAIEVVETENKELIENVTIIKLNSNFTGGHYKNALFMYDGDFLKSKHFVRLGKKYQKLKANENNSLCLNKEKLDKWLADGTISIVELKTVETVTKKTVYVKQKRKQKTAPTDLQIETVATAETETTEESTEPTTSNITYKLNEEKNGIEIYFSDIPSVEVRENLKLHGFRWSRYNKCWYAKQSDSTIAYAKSLSDATETEQETAVQPEKIEIPDFIDITQFTVSEETEKRLINNSLFGDMRKDGYESRSLQKTLSALLEETKEVVEMTDSNYYKKKLIEGFNGFCVRYSLELNNYLYNKSVNPSWAVTGRGNLNISRYNKKQDAIFYKMGKVVEMLEKQRNILNKYKNKIKADAVRKQKQAIQDAVNSLQGETIDFKTEKRKFNYYGYTYDTRAYISGNYFIMKMAGCYRIFENGTNKEVHSLKTTEKLDDAKAYVIYLESQLKNKAV